VRKVVGLRCQIQSQSLAEMLGGDIRQDDLFAPIFFSVGKQSFGRVKDLFWTSCTTTIRRGT